MTDQTNQTEVARQSTGTTLTTLLSDPGRFITEEELSDLLHVKLSTIRKWRTYRRGPAFHKVRQARLYLAQDVIDYLNSRRVQPVG